MRDVADPSPPAPTARDLGSVVALLSRVIEQPGGLPQKKRRFMRGLADLVDADAWYWAMLQQLDHHGRATPLELIHGGFTPAQLAAYAQSRDDHANPPPELPRLAELQHGSRGQPYTLTRQQLVDDRQWYGSGYYAHHVPRIGLDHVLYGNWPHPDRGRISVVAVFRSLGRPAFTERDRLLTHLLITHSHWLHADELPEDCGASVQGLTPRGRTVLRLLLEGMTEKQIAHHLRLSRHTVHDYVKAIYRHFSVTSRTDLLRRFMLDPA